MKVFPSLVISNQFNHWSVLMSVWFSLVSSLVMPLVCKDMVNILDVGVNSTNANHTSLSNFAFLYGVFPTAPSVAIYAAHYNMELEVVSAIDGVILLLTVIYKNWFYFIKPDQYRTHETVKLSPSSSPGDVRDGHQHVPVGADHLRVGMVTDDPSDGPDPPGDGAGKR